MFGPRICRQVSPGLALTIITLDHGCVTLQRPDLEHFSRSTVIDTIECFVPISNSAVANERDDVLVNGKS
jgi:hypothetical protein